MANSSIVSTLKKDIIELIINNDAIVTAIDMEDMDDPTDLINTHIFRFNKNPDTIDKAITFLTLMVHIPKKISSTRRQAYIYPTLEIYIVSHHSKMTITNIPKVTDSRNDYISILLDNLLNGKSFGMGQLDLISNEEGSYQTDYLYRRMLFQTIDINDSMCED